MERPPDRLALVARDPGALVTRLPRRPGQKEVRYAHLLSGEVAAGDTGDGAEASGATGAPAPRARADDERVAALERTVDELRAELAALRAQFVEFRAQFQ